MHYHIYCDESSQCADRYMIIGGLILREQNVQRFIDTMARYRKAQKMTSELKWTKVSRQKYAQYQAFVDYFFALNNANILRFHCIIIDNHHVNHRKFSGGDKEDGFYKFYYQLLLNKFGRAYCINERITFTVYLDHRQTKYKLGDLKRILNHGARKHLGMSHEPFRSIEPRDSKTCEPIQINDLLIGAVGWQKNQRGLLAGSSQAKEDLANYIADQAGLRSLTFNTVKRQERFTIWNLQLRK